MVVGRFTVENRSAFRTKTDTIFKGVSIYDQKERKWATSHIWDNTSRGKKQAKHRCKIMNDIENNKKDQS